MNVRPCWCWSRWQRLTEFSVVFFLFGIVVEYPLLTSSHNPMQKTFSLLSLNQLFASEKSPFNSLSVSIHKALNFLVFESFPWLSIVQNGLLSYLQWFCKLLLRLTLLRVMPLILCLQIFWLSTAKLVFNVEIFILETSKPPTWFISWSSVSHKLRQAFDGLQPQMLLD